MPKWMHDRAEHILAKNPDMPKSQAFAIATQQSHALGKSPKSYGTLKGREEAKAKYKTPGDDKKTADPGHLAKLEKAAALELERQKCAEILLELQKDAGLRDSLRAVGTALTEPIPGTKPWLINKDIARNAVPAGKLRPRGAGQPVRSGKLSGGNVYDVSRQAAQMGL